MKEAIKKILTSVVNNDVFFSVDENNEEGRYIISVEEADYRKILHSGGRIYKALRTLLRCVKGNSSLELVVNIIEKK